MHGAYGVIVAQELVELLDSEHNRIGTQVMKLSENIWNDENLIKVLKKGGVVVMPTDTIYGIVGRAENISAIHRIYTIRKRAPEKPCIILIGNINQLEIFGILLSQEQKNILLSYWPGPVSLIIDGPTKSNELFTELHRGTNTLAFRLPDSKELLKLLLEVGPLIAPSANPEGLPTAHNIEDAKKYFGDLVDLYLDGGEIVGRASKIIRLHNNGSSSIIRE